MADKVKTWNVDDYTEMIARVVAERGGPDEKAEGDPDEAYADGYAAAHDAYGHWRPLHRQPHRTGAKPDYGPGGPFGTFGRDTEEV